MRQSEDGRPAQLRLNNETDPRYVRRAFRYLRATVRAGRIAEKVLEDLERDGLSRRRFVIFWPSRFGVWSKRPISDYLVGTLGPAPEVRRMDLPGVRRVKLEIRTPDGSKKPSVYCTVPCVKGEGSDWKWGRVEFRLGACNLNSSPGAASFTFDWDPLHEQYRCGVVHRTKATPRKTFPTSSPLPATAVKNLCLCISSVITGSPHDEKTDPAVVGLHRSVPGWLEEEGLAEKIWAEIRVLMENHRTALTVLTT